MPPDFIAIGHIVKDILPDGWRAGGGVAYAAAQASRLGLNVAAVTACAPDLEPENLVPGVTWHALPSASTTSFENRYEGGKRQQRLPVVAAPIAWSDLPRAWLAAPIILLAPMFHEIDTGLPRRLARSGTLIGLAAQGWLRRREGDVVLPGRVEADPAWLAGDAVFLSEEDVEDPEAAEAWQRRAPVVVLTRGRRGCTVWDAAGRHDIAAFAAEEVDPTGAGDVFAAAFLVRFAETRDTVSAARFAAAAASLSVRGKGLEAIGDKQQIEALTPASQALSSPRW